jgi:hypothetical protein
VAGWGEDGALEAVTKFAGHDDLARRIEISSRARTPPNCGRQRRGGRMHTGARRGALAVCEARSARFGVPLLAVEERELGFEALVLVAQPRVVRPQGLQPLAQRCFGRPLPRGNAIVAGGRVVAQPLDRGAQVGLGV